jgi:hypothetical protein
MEYILTGMSVFLLALFSYMLGRLSAIGHFKRENERLNKEVHKLTDRDSKGRFTGGK